MECTARLQVNFTSYKIDADLVACPNQILLENCRLFESNLRIPKNLQFPNKTLIQK